RDKLTIVVPGRGHELDLDGKRLNAPRLLREVEGDFMVQVWVGGVPRPASGLRRAGLLLTDGDEFLRFAWGAGAYTEGHAFYTDQESLSSKNTDCSSSSDLPIDKPAYLLVERRGEYLVLATSLGGKDWCLVDLRRFTTLKRKVKAGVFAESTAPGPFKALFDKFRLTTLVPEPDRDAR